MMQNRFFAYLVIAAAIGLGIFLERAQIIEDLFVTYSEDIEYLAPDHMMMVVISGSIAIATGIPLGIWLTRPGMVKYAESAMQLLNIGTTIPTLAILALSMSLLGIGKLPAIFGLWVATLLPIVRNTFTGIRAVPAPMIEAATGIGMTRMQILIRVELPNALFVIFAGIRTALAINVGTVPLAFLIGGGGLGELIFTGIALDEFSMMIAGAIPVALLAIATDFLVGTVQYFAVPKGVNPNR